MPILELNIAHASVYRRSVSCEDPLAAVSHIDNLSMLLMACIEQACRAPACVSGDLFPASIVWLIDASSQALLSPATASVRAQVGRHYVGYSSSFAEAGALQAAANQSTATTTTTALLAPKEGRCGPAGNTSNPHVRACLPPAGFTRVPLLYANFPRLPLVRMADIVCRLADGRDINLPPISLHAVCQAIFVILGFKGC